MTFSSKKVESNILFISFNFKIIMNLENDKILITGGTGLMGQALASTLKHQGYKNIYSLSSQDIDLTNLDMTIGLFQKIKPTHVFHMAAAVHGIMGNLQNKGSIFLKNILINTNVIEAARLLNVKKIVAMGSVCAYPYPPPSLPLSEEMIWQGEPHAAENSYAHAKRAMLAQLMAYKESYNMDFVFVLSTNLYGPHDKFDIQFGHVVPSLIRKFYEAKQSGSDVVVWGDGSSSRDFIYSQDAAEALILMMKKAEGTINLASGLVYSIKDVVNILATHTQMKDHIIWDTSKPNGQGYRSYNLNKLLQLGFKPKTSLEKGLLDTYNWYSTHIETARK